MALISVIIPCYNASKYIGKCLKSFEAQKFKDFDIILVDDFSTDDTAQIVKHYIKKSTLDIYYYKNEVNCGPAFSRNKGIQFSKSKYIAFCDSDDWVEPNLFTCVYEKIKANNTDIIFYGYNSVIYTNKGNKINPHKLIVENNCIQTKSVLALPIDSLWSLVVKKEIISNVPAPNLRNGEDMAIIPLIIAKCENFDILNKCLYNYLCRANSASNTANEQIVNSLVTSFYYINDNMSDTYRNEVEFIGIKNLLYGALLILFKYSYDIRKAKLIISDFEKKYSNWINNGYFACLPTSKKIFLWCVKKKFFLGIKLLSLLHTALTTGSY